MKRGMAFKTKTIEKKHKQTFSILYNFFLQTSNTEIEAIILRVSRRTQ